MTVIQKKTQGYKAISIGTTRERNGGGIYFPRRCGKYVENKNMTPICSGPVVELSEEQSKKVSEKVSELLKKSNRSFGMPYKGR